ncbi:hypothetical protein IMSAG185_01077 [Lachnospiraceae bacterium]|jgi:hypothetical protein|nr:hypothetical protein [Lachnospiraceae bacterium]GFI65478.1 hypothetical protein IMSAG185_01077 [Lachnospiraceae bacterium]
MFSKKIDRFKLLLIAELIMALLLFFTCFQKETKVFTIFGDDMGGQMTETDGYETFSSETFELLPGVYQVRMEVSETEDQTVFAQVRWEQAPFKAVRNNGAAVLPGGTSQKFNVYVLDKVQTAYVYCRFSGSDPGILRSLNVYRTSMGNRMLLFILLVLFGLLDFMVIFRKRILSGKIIMKKQIVFWGLTAGIMISFFPYLTDYFSWGGDIDYHFGRIAFLEASLQQKMQFPVRMQGTWLYGHGYATSLFYGDLFLYFPACLMLLGFSIMTAYKMFVFAVTALGAWIAYHCFYRCVKEEYAALAGSLLYVLAPYRIFNFYNRGATGEYLAMTFLPLICCGMYLLYTEDINSLSYNKHKWYIVLGMSAILQSHLITSEMTAVLMALGCALCWRKTFRRRTFFQLLETVGIVLLVNMWFWLPLLYMIGIDTYQFQTVIQEEMVNGTELAGMVQLLPNKGSAQTGMWQCEPIQIGASALFLFLVCLLWRIKGHRMGAACRFFAVLSVVTVALSTKYFPWNFIRKLPLIGYFAGSLQFPFRWMAPAAALTALFCAFFMMEVRERGGARIKILAGISVLLAIMSAVYHVNDCAFQAPPLYLYNAENMGTVGVVNGEWLLAGTDKGELHDHGPVAEEGLLWQGYEKKGTDITIFVENTTAGIRYLELPLMGYKGYKVKEYDGIGQNCPDIAEERGDHNDLRIAIPAGYNGKIKVSWDGFALFHAAEAVSIASIVIILSRSWWTWRRKVKFESKLSNID